MADPIPLNRDVANQRQQPRLLRVRDIQHESGLGKSKVYDLISSGELKAVRIGRSVRVPAAEFERFLERIGA